MGFWGFWGFGVFWVLGFRGFFGFGVLGRGLWAGSLGRGCLVNGVLGLWCGTVCSFGVGSLYKQRGINPGDKMVRATTSHGDQG